MNEWMNSHSILTRNPNDWFPSSCWIHLKSHQLSFYSCWNVLVPKTYHPTLITYARHFVFNYRRSSVACVSILETHVHQMNISLWDGNFTKNLMPLKVMQSTWIVCGLLAPILTLIFDNHLLPHLTVHYPSFIPVPQSLPILLNSVCTVTAMSMLLYISWLRLLWGCSVSRFCLYCVLSHVTVFFWRSLHCQFKVSLPFSIYLIWFEIIIINTNMLNILCHLKKC